VSVKLYERTEALAIIDQLLLESEGDLTPEIEQLLNEAEMSFAEKAVSVAAKVTEFEATAAAARSEATRLAQRAKSFENKAGSLRSYLLIQMQIANKAKVEDARFTLSVRQNPWKLDAVLLTPERLFAIKAEREELTPALNDDEDIVAMVDAVVDAAADSPAVAPHQLTAEMIALLEPCVVVTPEHVVETTFAWDKNALMQLAKTDATIARLVAPISRGTRLEIK
jgi:hypothetical protein